MNKRSISILTATVLIASSLVHAASASPTPKCDAVEGDYILTLKDGVKIENELKTNNGKSVKAKYKYDKALNGFAAHLTSDEVCEYRGRGNVLDVELDGIVTADAIQTMTVGSVWGLDRIDANKGLSGSYSYNSNGAGVTAYVIDTGINTSHSDFGGRASVGTDAVGDGRNGIDCNGHGTHVAGTIGGSTYGVAKNVSLVAVRVLNCSGSGSTSGVIAGINWVAANHTVKSVANMSLGGGASTALDTAVKNLVASGVTTVVAAGNSAADAGKSSPARVTQAVTVGASDSADRLASYSNYGAVVDVIAPGTGITSAWISSTTASNTISGTSMATPHVAGAWAAILSSLPNNLITSDWKTYISAGVVTLSAKAKSAGTTTNLLYKNPTL